MPDTSKLLWTPTELFKENTNLHHYLDWLRTKRSLDFANYDELWVWSTTEVADFWESLWDYFSIISHSPYSKVLDYEQMPEVSWFPGSTLNYAEHIFRNATEDHPAILFQSERQKLTSISWASLKEKTAQLADYFKSLGVEAGDCIVAYLPNIPEATIGFLAANSLGAIWSSCSPDFGAQSVIDRFQQIQPKVLITVDGYFYRGKEYDQRAVVSKLVKSIQSLEKVIYIPYLNKENELDQDLKSITWTTAVTGRSTQLSFVPVPFDHPIWVLYSSGTTGQPKAITHSHGGVLLEHLKYLAFHNDVHPGERFFWFSTTGWMMWNFVQAALLRGATIVLYDGSPAYPNLDVLWRMADKAKVQHFGTSAPYLVACMKRGLQPGKKHNLRSLRSIGSTGAPLPPEAFDYVYSAIKKDLWLCSMSGGTDVCTAFVGGNPLAPVYEGEIQSRALGCALFAFDDNGSIIENEVGEMVITKPMPSMPIYFWNDPDKIRYLSSYFAMYEGVWRHGDWVKITDHNSLIISGRSDATLNRQGIRIGTAEIYQSLNKIPAIQDSLIVNLELSGGRHYMPLFVVLPDDHHLSSALEDKIKAQLKNDYSPRHVPDEIIQVEDIPYTISGKKLEAPVKKLLMGMALSKAANKDAMRNPDALEFFKNFAQQIKK
ncbi:MAG: acetoacetate--CoA ligase [Saprospiraceae bacterium]